MARAFVIRPFGLKQDSKKKAIDFERIHKELIKPALEAAQLSGDTTGEIVDAGNIREDMFALILEADVVICDITILNANVFYELGIRHALRKKTTLLIRGTPTADGTPFDLLTDRYMEYPVGDPGKAKGELLKRIRASLNSGRDADSPIFNMLPALPEVDVDRVQVVPADFTEEVGRARAARSRGWLRLLAEEVRTRRFNWQGLKLVGKAQWDLNDVDNARATWELVTAADPDDIDANLALANIYERGFRRSKDHTMFARSSQAIERVVKNDKAERKQKAEALALRGRNEKTQWRLQFEDLPTLEARRRAAMIGGLQTAYESYRKAFLSDLNHFWSGVAAVQLGSILMDLSKDSHWADAFESDEKAEQARPALETETMRLIATVRVSVDAAVERAPQGSEERMWAEISAADVRFVDPSTRDSRVLDAYLRAVPGDKDFAWDAAGGQLKLFRTLGIRAELAANIIEAMSTKRKVAAQEKAKQQDEQKQHETLKPLHLLLLAGHQIDAPDRPTPRFPPAREALARNLIGEKLKGVLNPNETFVAVACAAPGADILAHEICKELNVESTVCLPMPATDYARHTFGQLDAWRNRFLKIIESRKDRVLELSHQEGLPRWLHGAPTDPWERGNRWVMHMVQTWDAKRITLIALWDQRPSGDAAGGTAHFVELARKAGNVRVEVVDCNQLLS